jgi:pimeloyl-ACP methyl ester carboxylesterase
VSDSSQVIRFCKSLDGTRIAYAICGSGPPLVWIGHFARHLDYDWTSPVWRPWLSALTRHHTLIRYDLRGCGLSDRDVPEISNERMAEDFEAVVAAAALEKFSFMGTAGNVAPGLIHAARHPDRVSRLVLYAPHTRGVLNRPRTPAEEKEGEMRLKLFEMGWLKNEAPFGQFLTAVHAPDALPAQLRSLGELARRTTTPNNAVRIIRCYWQLDLRDVMQRVRSPTLILHGRDDPVIPFEEGRLAASMISGARFVSLESRNHILQETEPAWKTFVAALDEFLPSAHVSPLAAELTPREREILDVIASGQTNAEIASRLGISAKTVRNHVSLIFGKLGVHNRAQAVARARDAGFGRK